jgi:hypothetical protein
MLASQVVPWETRNEQPDIADSAGTNRAGHSAHPWSRVMLDRDLPALYGVETKNLNKAVRRNLDRFPADFMFQLTLDEAEGCAPSRFQFGTLKRGQNTKRSSCGAQRKN